MQMRVEHLTINRFAMERTEQLGFQAKIKMPLLTIMMESISSKIKEKTMLAKK